MRMIRLLCLAVIGISGCVGNSASKSTAEPAPPAAPREFRGVWVATVANIDWPSKPGLSTEQQQQEAIAILDKAKSLNLNAIVLQVRPAADALYASKLEPWSAYLTGAQGQPPEPFYDPLKFWIEKAHERGMELHAWFNPYRAKHSGAKFEMAATHISKTNPAVVREFNNWQWLDPAEPAAQDQSFNVFMDVVKRYDVDGIHIDDYFYPYPDYLKRADGTIADFPDDGPWVAYQQAGGKLPRDDWRRDNVNRLIERIYAGAHKIRPTVKFGISPFGIARPGKPPAAKGFDQFEKLFADTELWLKNGWCDYWTPQLYWRISATSQPYVGLLEYWIAINLKGRHIWPGNSISNASRPEWGAAEILNQIVATRNTLGATGNIFFSMKAFMSNTELADAVSKGPYAQPALVPASPWLDSKAPAAPGVRARLDPKTGSVNVSWSNPWFSEKPWQYAVWAKFGDEWRFNVFPQQSRSVRIDADSTLGSATAVCVSTVDRSGNESERVVISIQR